MCLDLSGLYAAAAVVPDHSGRIELRLAAPGVGPLLERPVTIPLCAARQLAKLLAHAVEEAAWEQEVTAALDEEV